MGFRKEIQSRAHPKLPVPQQHSAYRRPKTLRAKKLQNPSLGQITFTFQVSAKPRLIDGLYDA